uniref:Uncharacterized protein n=1 Tax=Pararge aegeria TaxID=116150 RepID=S4PUJ6_9NEOP
MNYNCTSAAILHFCCIETANRKTAVLMTAFSSTCLTQVLGLMLYLFVTMAVATRSYNLVLKYNTFSQ